MNKTAQIFRNFYALRSYNRIFGSKYCTFRKDGADSDQKDSTSAKLQKSVDEKNKISKEKVNVDGSKPQAQLSSTPKDVLASSDTISTIDSKSENIKTVLVESDVMRDTSATESSSNTDEHAPKKGNWLNFVKDHLESNVSPSNEVQSDRKSEETENANIKASKKSDPIPKNETFVSLLRRSAFVELGDPVNKLVIGEIYHVVDNDLYIDFGWKFPAVCSRPKRNPQLYNIGAKVLLRINDLELTAKFLGDTEYTSLLEADCTLLYRVDENGNKFVMERLQSRQ